MASALVSHHCGLSSMPGRGVPRGSSLLLVLGLAPRIFLWFSSIRKNQHFLLEIRPGNSGQERPHMEYSLLNYYYYYFNYYYYILHFFSILFQIISPLLRVCMFRYFPFVSFVCISEGRHMVSIPFFEIH